MSPKGCCYLIVLKDSHNSQSHRAAALNTKYLISAGTWSKFTISHIRLVTGQGRYHSFSFLCILLASESAQELCCLRFANLDFDQWGEESVQDGGGGAWKSLSGINPARCCGHVITHNQSQPSKSTPVKASYSN